MTVYRPWNDGLGDHWATCSLLRWFAATSTCPAKLSLHGLPKRQQDRLCEINRLLAHQELVALVDEPPDEALDGFDVWAAPVIPTVSTWEWPRCDRMVAYQFDGISSAQEKNPPLHEAHAILCWLTSRGFDTHPLGADRSLSQCVEILSRSVLFIGSDSGFSHVAHSVGTPCYIYEHTHPIITCHRQKQHVIVRSAADFESQARMLLDLYDKLG